MWPLPKRAVNRRVQAQYSVPGTQYSVLTTLYRFLAITLLLFCSFLPTFASGQPAAAPQTNKLPWETPPRTTEPLLRPPSSPADILGRFDIGPSQLESFFSGQPLSAAEEDVLIKILYRLPRMGRENIERWRQPAVMWDQLAAAPADHRAKVFHLSGRAKRAERHKLLAEQVELFEFNHYYRVSVALDGAPYEALVAARRIPAAWPLDAPIDEPAEADGLFLKVGDTAAEPAQLIFAADRIAWYPDRADPAGHIGSSQLALAKAGMDLGLWDDIRDAKDHALTAADREGFYQLLSVVGRADAGQLRPAIDQALSVVPLLEKPAEHFGDILPVQGIARRVMKVPVSDADIQSRFGIDHYYEIDLFVPLGDAALQFGKDPTGEKNAVYRNTFPTTLIVRDLPADLREGENVHEQVRADGVFFKVWTYKSSYATRFGQLQLAPLFIAHQPRVVPVVTTVHWVTASLVVVAFALAIGVTGVIVLWYGRSDRAALAKSKLRPQSSAPPDFSHLT
jgi:hypothetical protein